MLTISEPSLRSGGVTQMTTAGGSIRRTSN